VAERAGGADHRRGGRPYRCGAGGAGARRLGDGAAASLFGAGLGLLVVLAGGAHGLGWLPGRPAVGGFFVLFLLPLVSGALAQLLPVWRFPGR
jgi:hypothetical protein